MGFPVYSMSHRDTSSASQRSMHPSPVLSQSTTTNCPGSPRWQCTSIQSLRVQRTNHAEEPRAGPGPPSVRCRRAQSPPLTGLIISLRPPRRRRAPVRRFGKKRVNRDCGGDVKAERRKTEMQRTCEEGGGGMREEREVLVFVVWCYSPMLNERG